MIVAQQRSASRKNYGGSCGKSNWPRASAAGQSLGPLPPRYEPPPQISIPILLHKQTAALAGTGQNFNRGFADLARDVDVKAIIDEGGGDAAVTSRVRCAFAA